MTLLWTGQKFPVYHVDAPGIADLELSSQAPAPAPAASVHAPTGIHATIQSAAPYPFEDPAILSFSKPQGLSISTNPSTFPIQQVAVSPIPLDRSTTVISTQATPRTLTPTASRVENQPGISAATLSEPFDNLNFGGDSGHEQQTTEEDWGAEKEVAPTADPRKRVRKGGRNNKANNEVAPEATQTQPTLIGTDTHPQKEKYRGKGWRQTAFVEPIDTPSSKKTKAGKRGQRNKKLVAEEINGWATEDATDIQEMGDFDFEGNLSKFDKRRVFDEIRNDDMTAGEERLVSFNRRARPGTNGGRNLHPTENVLDDDPPAPNRWNSEPGETEEEISEGRFSSGRNSRRARSRTGVPAPHRKGSAIISSNLSSTPLSRVVSNRTSSPIPHSAGSGQNGSLWVTTTNRRCPCVSPVQMLEIEQLAVGEIGLSEEMVAENAGRSIAEAAVSQASDLTSSSTVIILAGNHKTGMRAICAGRHLKNRGYRVTVCILGSEDDFLDSFKRQVEILKKIGVNVAKWQNLNSSLSGTDYIPDLIIDALFGVHVSFDDLRTDDQATALEMVSWINRSSIEVLSIDVPSGLSASTGREICYEGIMLIESSRRDRDCSRHQLLC